MRLLAFGDVHLKGSGETPDYDGVTLPVGTDAVLTVGDVVHQMRPADVDAGREFYSHFGDARRPTYAVPGNHDPAGDHGRLIPDGIAAEVIHGRVVSVGEIDVVGWGCEETEFAPEVDCTDFESLDPRGRTGDRRFVADETAERLEDALLAHVTGGVGERALAERLEIRSSELAEFARQLEALREAYRRLAALVERATPPFVFASHVPPYGTEIDRHHSIGRREADMDELHVGSIALKLILREYSPALSLSGHSHRQGYETLDAEDGPVHALNLGFRGVGTITIDPDGNGFSYALHS